MVSAKVSKQQPIEKYASREKQEITLRNKLLDIALEILVDAGFTVDSNQNLGPPNNELLIFYRRNKEKEVTEINGNLTGKIEGKSFDLARMTFDYQIQSRMNYFAQFPENHSFYMSTSGTRVTKQQLRNAFEGYVSKVVLGHKEFFDQLEG